MITNYIPLCADVCIKTYRVCHLLHEPGRFVEVALLLEDAIEMKRSFLLCHKFPPETGEYDRLSENLREVDLCLKESFILVNEENLKIALNIAWSIIPEYRDSTEGNSSFFSLISACSAIRLIRHIFFDLFPLNFDNFRSVIKHLGKMILVWLSTVVEFVYSKLLQNLNRDT